METMALAVASSSSLLSSSSSSSSSSAGNLLQAIQDHDVKQLKYYLDHGCDETSRLECGMDDVGILECAVHEGFHLGVQELLTKRVFQPDVVEKSLEYAMTHSLLDVVRVFLMTALEGVIQVSVFDVFRYAMQQRQYDLAVAAAKHDDFDVNSEDVWNQHRPLVVAVYHDQSHLAEMLLEDGAVLEASDGSGMTALMVGCVVRSVECCRVLFEHGANPNPRPPGFCSPLRALYSYSTDPDTADLIIDLLLRAGLNLNRERWLEKLESLPKKISTSTHDYLKQLCRVPATLKTTCFTRIRHHLDGIRRGTSLVKPTEALPLPTYLKRYLQMTSY